MRLQGKNKLEQKVSCYQVICFKNAHYSPLTCLIGSEGWGHSEKGHGAYFTEMAVKSGDFCRVSDKRNIP